MGYADPSDKKLHNQQAHLRRQARKKGLPEPTFPKRVKTEDTSQPSPSASSSPWPFERDLYTPAPFFQPAQSPFPRQDSLCPSPTPSFSTPLLPYRPSPSPSPYPTQSSCASSRLPTSALGPQHSDLVCAPPATLPRVGGRPATVESARESTEGRPAPRSPSPPPDRAWAALLREASVGPSSLSLDAPYMRPAPTPAPHQTPITIPDSPVLARAHLASLPPPSLASPSPPPSLSPSVPRISTRTRQAPSRYTHNQPTLSSAPPPSSSPPPVQPVIPARVLRSSRSGPLQPTTSLPASGKRTATATARVPKLEAELAEQWALRHEFVRKPKQRVEPKVEQLAPEPRWKGELPFELMEVWRLNMVMIGRDTVDIEQVTNAESDRKAHIGWWRLIDRVEDKIARIAKYYTTCCPSAVSPR